MNEFPVPGWKEPSIGVFGPREVVRSRKALAIHYGLLAAFAVILLAGGLLTTREVSQLRALAQEGVVVQAKLVRKFETGESRNSRTLGYRYLVGRVPFDVELTPSRYEYDMANIGDTAPVTYLRSDPEEYQLGKVDLSDVSSTRARLMWETVLLGMCLQLGGLFMRRRTLEQLRILRDYVATPGEVIGFGKVQTVGKSDFQDMTVRFHLPDGRFSEFRQNYSRHITCHWEEGEELTVLVDPDEKDRPYPLFEITLAKLDGMSR